MKTDKHTIEVLVRAFFHAYFTKAAGAITCDIASAQPITIKQLLIKHIDEIANDFNIRIARAFAFINEIEVPQKLSTPKTFEGATALIRYTLKGDKKMYEYMVERYKYHFTQALSGTVEKADIIDDTDMMKAIEFVK